MVRRTENTNRFERSTNRNDLINRRRLKRARKRRSRTCCAEKIEYPNTSPRARKTLGANA